MATHVPCTCMSCMYYCMMYVHLFIIIHNTFKIHTCMHNNKLNMVMSSTVSVLLSYTTRTNRTTEQRWYNIHTIRHNLKVNLSKDLKKMCILYIYSIYCMVVLYIYRYLCFRRVCLYCHQRPLYNIYIGRSIVSPIIDKLIP